MGKKQFFGTASRYDAVCTQLCRDLKAKGVVLLVVEGREGNGMAVAARPDFAEFGMPHVLGPFLAGIAATMAEGAGPAGMGVDTPGEDN